MVTGNKTDAKSLNAFLDGIQSKIHEIHRQMTEADLKITAETVKNRFIGKIEKERTLLDVFKDHNRKMEGLISQEFEKSNFQSYETALMHTRDFIL